ncbi:MAG TPA: alpha-amylase family glycosyl hydrolase [Steroidobacteraceae bacterium]|nr:alpha-amylase family glycosyl hydrolase [Steroidobacteraceae bacterium]
MADSHAWWKKGIVYQIYPRSFQDSNGDGIGDLPGIISRLNYLCALGVTAVWLSPIFPSPMADFGYDICDYTNIDPIFGTLSDFDRLVTQMHRRGLKLILDFVPNHTSDLHPWFLESRASRSSARRNWYIWHDPAPDGGPPTNWLSEFGGPAWTFDPSSGQYYYHAYLPQQPDLNWRNPQVRAAMHDVMRFWLDRGVDGFRVDAIHMLIEDEALRDNEPNPQWQPGQSPARQLLRTHTADLPETHTHVMGMRAVTDAYEDRVLIGEAYLPIERMMRYYGDDLSGFHLPFNFHLIRSPWQSRAIAALANDYEAALPPGGWPNWVLGNHDKPRVASRLGGIPQARLAALLLLTLRGTPTIYNGEEIGMVDGEIRPDEVQDPWGKNAPGFGRDPCRTPMQWSDEPGAGFTRGTPWLPIPASAATCNVKMQSEDPDSMLTFYRRLIHLRQREPALSVGTYQLLEVTDSTMTFERTSGDRCLIVAVNFSDQSQAAPLMLGQRRLLSTHDGARERSHEITLLAPFEGIVCSKPALS